MRKKTLLGQLLGLGLWGASGLAASEGSVTPDPVAAVERAAPRPVTARLTKVYSCAELLVTAELIVLAEVLEKDVDGVGLRVISLLKRSSKLEGGPWGELPESSGFVAEDQVKRAEERLEELAKGDPAKTPGKQNPAGAQPPQAPAAGARSAALWVTPVEPMALPSSGTQAIFVLWERDPAAKGGKVRFLLNHPQCVYDVTYGNRIMAALANRRAAEEQGYLRAWDRKMASQLARREREERLRGLEAGNQQGGLQIRAMLPRRSTAKDDNSFQVTACVQNFRESVQYLYDGPLAQFGVRVRRKGEPALAALILPVPVKGVGEVDNDTLNIVDATDFTKILSKDKFSRELAFEAKDHPILTTFQGTYLLNVYYLSEQSGKGIENLELEAWTGSLLSEDVEIQFRAPQRPAEPGTPASTPSKPAERPTTSGK